MSLFGTYWLSSANFVSLRVFRFFLFQFARIHTSSLIKITSVLLRAINVTGLVQFRKRLSCILPPFASLELVPADYLRETNISNCMYHLLMVTCSLDALKKSWRRKDMRIKMKKSRCYNKLYTVERRQESKRSG